MYIFFPGSMYIGEKIERKTSSVFKWYVSKIFTILETRLQSLEQWLPFQRCSKRRCRKLLRNKICNKVWDLDRRVVLEPSRAHQTPSCIQCISRNFYGMALLIWLSSLLDKSCLSKRDSVFHLNSAPVSFFPLPLLLLP